MICGMLPAHTMSAKQPKRRRPEVQFLSDMLLKVDMAFTSSPIQPEFLQPLMKDGPRVSGRGTGTLYLPSSSGNCALSLFEGSPFRLAAK